MSGQLQASAALPLGERAPGTHDRIRGTHSRSGRGGEEKTPIATPGWNLTPVVQPVAWSLYLLSYPDS